MTKKYDSVVYIGRFQPFHNAHAEIIRRASLLTDNIIIIVGSAKQPSTFENPWSSESRINMIRSWCKNNIKDNNIEINIESNVDTLYDDIAWVIRTQNIVNRYSKKNSNNIAIIGHSKDESSYYLKSFPQWSVEEVELIEPLNATDIRKLYFKENPNLNFLKNVVPEITFKFLTSNVGTEWFNNIVNENNFILEYKKQYEHLKYPPIFLTADAVVIQSGHVLMVRRKNIPGKGLLAFPGGYVNAYKDKSIEDAMIRELYEETKIKLPEIIIRKAINEVKVFDSIKRSPRGRIITHAFEILLTDNGNPLPKVKGSDDAEKAIWIPLSEIKSEECFEDHYQILQHFVGNLP